MFEKLCIGLFVVLTVLSGPGVGTAKAEVVPGDVLTAARELHATIAALQAEAGVEPAPPPSIEVNGAQPREVWFQAREVWGLADRLATENVGDVGEPPAVPVTSIRPAHVLAVVQLAQARLASVATARGVSAGRPGEPALRTTTPSDVFEALLHAGVQLGSLLDRPPDPGDAWKSLTRCVILAGRLLAEQGADERIPVEPPVVPTSADDVHRRLGALIGETARLARARGHAVSDLTVPADARGGAAQLVQISTWLESELQFLVQESRTPSGPRAWDPGAIGLAELGARVSVLEAQLALLLDPARR